MSEKTNTAVQQQEQQSRHVPDVVPGFGSKSGLELAIRAANVLSKSTLVPKEYQGNIANCIIALNMANRMNADPLMVMQNLYIVYGKPSWSSQFLISTFNTSGKFSALRYEWVGTRGKDDWGCRAWAIEKATGEKLIGSAVTIGLAKAEGWYSKTGSKWQTMPEQMLMYRAASWFIRAYAPELAMGMHTAEEIYDTIDLTKDDYEVKIEQEIKHNANKETIDVEPPAPGEQPEQSKTQDNPKNKSPKKKEVKDAKEQLKMFEGEPPF
ncbi:MAG: hypothetical protein QM399_01055 [Bacillota bacterium]|nr:hypothetical protein [Bacillota bacterium]